MFTDFKKKKISLSFKPKTSLHGAIFAWVYRLGEGLREGLLDSSCNLAGPSFLRAHICVLTLGRGGLRAHAVPALQVSYLWEGRGYKRSDIGRVPSMITEAATYVKCQLSGSLVMSIPSSQSFALHGPGTDPYVSFGSWELWLGSTTSVSTTAGSWSEKLIKREVQNKTSWLICSTSTVNMVTGKRKKILSYGWSYLQNYDKWWKAWKAVFKLEAAGEDANKQAFLIPDALQRLC